MEKQSFNEMLRQRTKDAAVRIIKMTMSLPKHKAAYILSDQILRSSTSMAANYRAACRSRSKAEFYSKLSIAVEEADETLFWIECIEDSGMVKATRTKELKQEVTEILSILAKARSNTHATKME